MDNCFRKEQEYFMPPQERERERECVCERESERENECMSMSDLIQGCV